VLSRAYRPPVEKVGLGVAIIEAIDMGCPDLKVTLKGRDVVVWAKQFDDPACEAEARKYVNQYRKEMPSAWCLALMSIINVDRGGMVELRKGQ